MSEGYRMVCETCGYRGHKYLVADAAQRHADRHEHDETHIETCTLSEVAA